MAWHFRRERIPPQRTTDRSRTRLQRLGHGSVRADFAFGDLLQESVDARLVVGHYNLLGHGDE